MTMTTFIFSRLLVGTAGESKLSCCKTLMRLRSDVHSTQCFWPFYPLAIRWKPGATFSAWYRESKTCRRNRQRISWCSWALSTIRKIKPGTFVLNMVYIQRHLQTWIMKSWSSKCPKEEEFILSSAIFSVKVKFLVRITITPSFQTLWETRISSNLIVSTIGWIPLISVQLNISTHLLARVSEALKSTLLQYC